MVGSSVKTRRRFFPAAPRIGQSDASGNESSSPSLDPACRSRTELIPRLARAQSVDGKWKYLVEDGERGDVQHFRVTVCEGAGGECINDEDSPHGRKTTRCRQAFKVHKLLAVDETGEVQVDSFHLPSACVCHYVQADDVFVGFRSAMLAFNSPPRMERCESGPEKIEGGRRSKQRQRLPLRIQELPGGVTIGDRRKLKKIVAKLMTQLRS